MSQTRLCICNHSEYNQNWVNNRGNKNERPVSRVRIDIIVNIYFIFIHIIVEWLNHHCWNEHSGIVDSAAASYLEILCSILSWGNLLFFVCGVCMFSECAGFLPHSNDMPQGWLEMQNCPIDAKPLHYSVSSNPGKDIQMGDDTPDVNKQDNLISGIRRQQRSIVHDGWCAERQYS